VVEEIHTIVAKGERRRNFDRTQSKSRGSGSSVSGGSSGISAGSSSGKGISTGLGGGPIIQSPMQRHSQQVKTPY